MLYPRLFSAIVACLFFFTAPARASSSTEVCQLHDDKAELAAVISYFTQNLKEHEQQGFSRPLVAQAKSRANAFYEQRIHDKRAELCADRLKLAEEIKSVAHRVSGNECVGPAIVGLMESYMSKIAKTFDQNRRTLGALRDEHEKNIKLKLFEIAKGSTAGIEGAFKGYKINSAPQGVRMEWLKLEASKLGGEAHLVWGDARPEKNPLVVKNLEIAREAVRVRQERDAAKRRYGTDGIMPTNCKLN